MYESFVVCPAVQYATQYNWALVRVECGESTSLPWFSGTLWLRAEAPDEVLFIGQIERFDHLTCIQTIDLRRAYDKFPDFFRMATFTDSIHMKL